MAAPIMAIARFISGRKGQEKVHGFMRKLYKKSPVSDFGEKVSKSGMTKAWGKDSFRGKINTSGKMKIGSGAFNKAKYYSGRAISGSAKRAAPIGAHIKKHRKAYGWGATGAAAWDILDND